MTAAVILDAPSRAERLSAVLCAVRRLRPARAARGVGEGERACWGLLEVALDCALRLAGLDYVTPLEGVPRTIGEAHAAWARVSVEVLDVLRAEARGLARGRSRVAEHALALRGEWAALARRVDRLFEDIAEVRA